MSHIRLHLIKVISFGGELKVILLGCFLVVVQETKPRASCGLSQHGHFPKSSALHQPPKNTCWRLKTWPEVSVCWAYWRPWIQAPAPVKHDPSLRKEARCLPGTYHLVSTFPQMYKLHSMMSFFQQLLCLLFHAKYWHAFIMGLVECVCNLSTERQRQEDPGSLVARQSKI